MYLAKHFCKNSTGLADTTAIATSAKSVRIASDQNVGIPNVRKYYETLLILTLGLSEWSLGMYFCANPLGFANKTIIATSAQPVPIVSDKNAGIRCVQKVL